MKKPLRKILGAAIAVTCAVALAGCGNGGSSTPTSSGSAAETYSIGIIQWADHTSLDAATAGFIRALEDSGLDVKVDQQNAHGDPATATNIVNTFKTNKVDLVLANATPAAQSAAQALSDIPVLFTSVTDPVSAQLVASNEAPGGNVTGTTDMNPVAAQMALIKEIVPNAQTIGIVYSSGEVNSEVQVALAKEAATAMGMQVVEKTVTNTNEVGQAVQALGAIDAIYVPTDNNVVSSLGNVIQFAEGAKIPVVVGETDSVRNGGIVTLGLDYEKLGYQTGEMAVRILKDGADPASMPVEFQKEAVLMINKSAAARMGVELPDSLVSRADEVID